MTYFFSSAALEAAEAAWDGENGPFPPIGGRPGGRKPVKGYRRPPNAALAAPYGDLNIGLRIWEIPIRVMIKRKNI